jgi:hypothetical protein
MLSQLSGRFSSSRVSVHRTRHRPDRLVVTGYEPFTLPRGSSPQLVCRSNAARGHIRLLHNSHIPQNEGHKSDRGWKTALENRKGDQAGGRSRGERRQPVTSWELRYPVIGPTIPRGDAYRERARAWRTQYLKQSFGVDAPQRRTSTSVVPCAGAEHRVSSLLYSPPRGCPVASLQFGFQASPPLETARSWRVAGRRP